MDHRLLAAATTSRDFTRTHEVANVLLEKLVVVVELVVLLLDGLDAVEDHDERVLQSQGMSVDGAVS